MTESASTLVNMMKTGEDFEFGARRLSDFFKRTEEHWDAGDVLDGLFTASTNVSPKALEYILFSFFHIGRSDIDTAMSVMKMRRLAILLIRELRFRNSLLEGEHAIFEKIRNEAKLQSMEHFYRLCGDARAWIGALFSRQKLHEDHSGLLALLIECEADALIQRVNYISDRIDPYDLKAMSKILPLITIYEERIRSYKMLASSIKNGEEIGKSIISFEYFMKDDVFRKWLVRVNKKDSLRKFHETLLCQREKKIPTRALVGISSITRCVLGVTESANEPLDWISDALAISGDYKFAVECGGMTLQVKKLLGGSTVRLNGSTVQGDYNREAFAGLTGADMLTTPLDRPDPDPQDLVNRAINNETILPRLLDNPAVYNKGGLVEHVARTSRSVNVLTKIASTRELYSGSANLGVPAALLKSPCAIPMSLLRGFISPRYVSTSDLREIVRYGHSVRRDVLSEVENFMKRRG